MKQHLAKLCVTAAIAASVAGCASVESAKSAKGTGVEKTYSANCSDVINSVSTIAESTGGDVKETNNKDSYVLIQYGATAFSWGERVAVFCDSDKNDAIVEVVSIRAYSQNITAKDWAPAIFSGLDAKFN